MPQTEPSARRRKGPCASTFGEARGIEPRGVDPSDWG